MDIYIKLFEVLFPVFFVVGIGYYLGKKNPKIDTTFITDFAANVGTPAMIIYALNPVNISFDILITSCLVLHIVTPFPAANPSALTTIGRLVFCKNFSTWNLFLQILKL